MRASGAIPNKKCKVILLLRTAAVRVMSTTLCNNKPASERRESRHFDNSVQGRKVQSYLFDKCVVSSTSSANHVTSKM